MGGLPSEIINYLTNVPQLSFENKNLNAASMFTLINNADDLDYIITIDTPGGSDKDKCLFNLPCGHAYSVVNA